MRVGPLTCTPVLQACSYLISQTIYAWGDYSRLEGKLVDFVLPLQGLLALEGELTPILVQMVKSANMNGLLDSDGDSLSSCQHRVKARLHHILQQDTPFGPEDYDQVRLSLSLCPIYP